jgi:hypothetical protein
MNSQAHPPSENQQLEDARIAMEQAIVRITELERQLATYRKAYNALWDAARAVIDSTHFYRSLGGAPWIATGRAQIEALSRCVSSNSVESAPAQKEDTQ